MRATALGMVPKTVTNTIGMVLIEIPAGTFTMGSPDYCRSALRNVSVPSYCSGILGFRVARSQLAQ